jgi:hypothetical protein
MPRFVQNLFAMPKNNSTALQRRVLTSSDLSVPSARTELILSESLIDAAASIQNELLDGKRPTKANGRRRAPGWKGKLRRSRSRVIELKLQ